MITYNMGFGREIRVYTKPQDYHAYTKKKPIILWTSSSLKTSYSFFKPFFVGAHFNLLKETIHLNTHRMGFEYEIEKLSPKKVIIIIN